MYTHIQTQDHIVHLSKFVFDDKTWQIFSCYPAKALVQAITVLDNNNWGVFEDIIVGQLKIIARGMSQSPILANFYVALHINVKIIDKFECLDY